MHYCFCLKQCLFYFTILVFKLYRVTGLIKSGSIAHSERPLWYDVYRSFPPAQEPSLSRPAPQLNIPKLIYPEDIVRAYATFQCIKWLLSIDFNFLLIFYTVLIAENSIDVMEWQLMRNQ